MSGRSPYEVYAKRILEAMYPERYGTLLLRDKPDLQTADGEAGIEVMSVNGETFERLVTEITAHNPLQAPTDQILKLCAQCGIEYHAWRTFVIHPLPAAGFLEPFRRKLKKLNAGYAFLGRYDLFLYSDRHTLADFELEPLLDDLRPAPRGIRGPLHRRGAGAAPGGPARLGASSGSASGGAVFPGGETFLYA